jgi:hypothetical protein
VFKVAVVIEAVLVVFKAVSGIGAVSAASMAVNLAVPVEALSEEAMLEVDILGDFTTMGIVGLVSL